MELVYVLREYFASLELNRIRELPVELLGEDSKGWVIKEKNEVGVGVIINKDINVNERFTNVNFYNRHIVINNSTENVLLLTCENNDQRYEFASIAAVFLDPGKEGMDRKLLETEPLTWWKKWKDLIGNASVEKSVHSILGEMLAVKYLAEQNSKASLPNWTGAKGQSVDVEHGDRNYEVKTTTNKYENIVNINSQFQLSSIFNADLIFVRVEEVSSGVTLNEMVEELEYLGFDRKEIEENMERLGVPENSSARERNFAVLEGRIYKVADKFSAHKLKDSLGEASPHILKIQYTIDLTGIPHEEIKL
ncbi:PD-(D/E)XK motif protein [Salimicrobium humidisoli]|uniref:PD-(D/E)XK family member n=1 Tax=Salimicrobium humidisoli TaxID=2029857 RepID=A0ABX4HW54_9BACI|nr:PD-(D/E)XK motif protein [Salimicrobium humidisoli]PBB06925.1 hypothetical protein CKW00_00245 [Salimicrobium humidisoli]